MNYKQRRDARIAALKQAHPPGPITKEPGKQTRRKLTPEQLAIKVAKADATWRAKYKRLEAEYAAKRLPSSAKGNT